MRCRKPALKSALSLALPWPWARQVRTVTIDRAKEAGGLGLGFNGGELLLLAIGGCYSNDIYREAAKRGLRVENVEVKVTADWAGEPVRAQNVCFSVSVEAEATAQEILDLIHHTDSVAEIPNSLRLGTHCSPTGGDQRYSTKHPMTTSFQIDTIRIGDGSLFLVAGPCVIESEEHAHFYGGSDQRRHSLAQLPFYL